MDFLNNTPTLKRYSRHVLLPGFDIKGQAILCSSRVLVIGAGGLGCPVLQYLAAAGIDNIGIIDHDIVEESNLQRQVLYTHKDIGSPKATQAAEKLRVLNPHIIVNEQVLQIDNTNILDCIRQYDIIVDCTDNFLSRYIINDACVLLDKPLIFGAIYQYEGQVAIFNVKDKEGNKTNYRHLFPIPPQPDDAPDCNAAGVLNVLPGIIGMLQATEVIKLLTNTGEPLINTLYTYNALTLESYKIEIAADETVNNLIPADREAFISADYKWMCNTPKEEPDTIHPQELKKLLDNSEVLIIDVREPDELPKADFQNLNIPLSSLKQNIPEIEHSYIIVFCQMGARSMKAAHMLKEKYGKTKNIKSLEGGMHGWLSYL